MRPLLYVLALLNAFPALAEAAKLAPGLQVGDQVLVTGSLHRKCSARVQALPSPGFANLRFDRAACGDASLAYDVRHLQHLTFVPKAHDLAEGDTVVVPGHFGNSCSGRVKEVSKAGYAAIDLDSLLCADTASLYKAGDVHKVQFVSETDAEDHRYFVGQKVTAPGIHDGETCRGEIRRLTDDGLADIQFEALTCAYGGKLYSVGDLKELKPAAPKRHASGELIFQRVMREIASQKKTKKNARL